MSVSIVVVSNRFPAIGAAFDAKVDAAFTAAGDACTAAADPLTPVRTGALRANKTMARGPDSLTITWDQFYAGYQNFGTRYITGKHFAEQGVSAAESVFLAGMAAAAGVG